MLKLLPSNYRHTCLAVLALTLAAPAGAGLVPVNSERSAAVAERGAQVMPFDLDRTLHVFTPTADGGVQKVVAKDPADTGQIRLIQEHLADIARRFAQGDFSGPEHIHGPEMPGLATLKAQAAAIRFVYKPIPDGGVIHYSAASPELVAALHDFFQAQVADHGKHATMGDHAAHHSPQGEAR